MSDFRDFARQIPRAATVLTVRFTKFVLNQWDHADFSPLASRTAGARGVLDVCPRRLSIDRRHHRATARRRQGSYGRDRMAIDPTARRFSRCRRGVTMGGPSACDRTGQRNWQDVHRAGDAGGRDEPIERHHATHRSCGLAGVLKYVSTTFATSSTRQRADGRSHRGQITRPTAPFGVEVINRDDDWRVGSTLVARDPAAHPRDSGDSPLHCADPAVSSG